MVSIKKLFEPTDMTVGSPAKSIILFTIPMLIGNIAQQLYNTVDSIVVGHYIGDSALAAVGSAGPLLNMLLVLFVGISTGVGIMVSQYFGAKDREELSHTIGTAITLTALCSLLLMAMAPFVVRPMLELLNTPAGIIDGCTDYLTIMMYGIAGVAYYNILSGILRGMGDSFSALIYLLIATVVNIVLDIYFVAKVNMGVGGVALATVIAQGFSSICCVFKLMKMKGTFDLGFKQLKPTGKHSRQIVKLGLPSGLAQMIFSSAAIVVQSLTNSFGETLIAANIIVMRVDGFAMMPNMSFGAAMTTFTGQNVGARKLDRVHQGAKQGTIIALICSATITVTILIFGRYLMALFTDTPSLIAQSMYQMRILSAGYIAMAVTQCLSGVMRGAGDTLTPMWVSFMTTVMIRVPVAYGISFLTRTEELPFGRFECIPGSLLTSWICGALITTFFFRKGAWRQKAML